MLISAYRTHLYASLVPRIAYGLVTRFKRNRKSVFDFTDFNEDWIPRVTPYHKTRKPRQSAWTDSAVQYPKLIPPLRPQMHPRKYIQIIQQQEKEKIQRRRQFLVPEIRAGDVVQITYQQTFQSEQVVKYKGLVIGISKRNSLMAGLDVVHRLGGVNLQSHYPINSPKIRNLQLVGRGSGTFKSQMNYLWDRNMISKSTVTTPMRNKGNSKRKDDIMFEGTQSTKIKNFVADVVTSANEEK